MTTPSYRFFILASGRIVIVDPDAPTIVYIIEAMKISRPASRFPLSSSCLPWWPLWSVWPYPRVTRHRLGFGFLVVREDFILSR
ncbi:hypothetical protein EHH54_11290 [Rhizobium leguminosarum]|nr:hypothetical protein EHH54_11290 [Rhizobium leguminosarum]